MEGTVAIPKFLLLSPFLVALAGCSEGPIPVDDRAIQILVRDQHSRPVEGAIVQGGIDWDYFQARTNSDGIASLPSDAEGKRASISKPNYLPNVVPKLYTGIYPLHETPRTMTRIGNVAGSAIRFGPGELISLDYSGTYHVYSFSNHSFSEVVARQMADSAILIKSIRLNGDTLWCSTHSNGIFAFSLRDRLAPRLLFRLKNSGDLWPIIVKDSLLIAGNAWTRGPVRIFVYRSDGGCTEIARVSDYYVRRMERIGDAVILFGPPGTFPVVLDISDPAHPRVAFTSSASGFTNAFFTSPYIILTSNVQDGDATHPVRFKAYRVSARAEVTPEGEFSADAWIAGIVSGERAYGLNYFEGSTISILEGSVSSGFTTVATMTGFLYDDIAGAAPPYFIVDGGLWKLSGL